MSRRLILLVAAGLALLLGACAAGPSPLPTLAASAPTFTSSATPGPTGEPPTAPGEEIAVSLVLAPPTPAITPGVTPVLPTPTDTPSPTPPPTETPTPVATPTATPTPHPFYSATIDGMTARDYPGGEIRVLSTLEQTDAYTRYYIAYPSDGLTITGIMQVSPGEGPFPVIILNHGYHDRDSYWPGSGTWMAAEYLNGRGYLTIAPDYRSWGQSDWGPSFFHTGLVADVLNLVSSLPSLPQADASRVGMWGHSMGGGITTKVLTIDHRVKAAVVYASNSPDDADLIARWGRGCLPGESQATAVCNPGEAIPAGTPQEIIDAYLRTATDPAALRAIAPLHYLDRVSAPVQIHIGAADGAEYNATPPEWSTKLYDAYIAAGKPVELFTYEGQGHLFAGEAWTTMMERSAALFDAYVK